MKWRYKVWCLADAATGYIDNFDVNTRKSDTAKEKGMTGEKLVMNSVIRNQSCLVAFDNFFTTYPLMKRLLDKGTLAIGIVRSNRKGSPDLMQK
ncbi:hypothetical protein JTB14_024992 [Gonioctena quinquepunctata]|nr:hypothetical protein JTB14_024992 [Gonioctena quinquepunctata]